MVRLFPSRNLRQRSCILANGLVLFRGVSAAADPPLPAADAGGPRLLRGSQPRVHAASDQTQKALRHHQRAVWRPGHRERVQKQGPLDVSRGAGDGCQSETLRAGLILALCVLRGKSPISVFLSNKNKELEKLKQVEATLDGLIRSCAQQLFDITDDDKNATYPCLVLLSGLRKSRNSRAATLL